MQQSHHMSRGSHIFLQRNIEIGLDHSDLLWQFFLAKSAGACEQQLRSVEDEDPEGSTRSLRTTCSMRAVT